MSSQKSPKMTKTQVTYSEVARLIEPTDQPEPRSGNIPFALNGRVAAWIVAHCLNGESFSIARLLQDLALHNVEPSYCITVVNLCGKDDDGLNLWRCNGLYLPCRENAAKAVIPLAAWFLKGIAEGFGFQNVPALVEAINALPSGLEVIARDRQPDTAE